MTHYSTALNMRPGIRRSPDRKPSSTLSILTAIFPGGPGLAGTRMSPFCILLMMGRGGVTQLTVSQHWRKEKYNSIMEKETISFSQKDISFSLNSEHTGTIRPHACSDTSTVSLCQILCIKCANQKHIRMMRRSWNRFSLTSNLASKQLQSSITTMDLHLPCVSQQQQRTQQSLPGNCCNAHSAHSVSDNELHNTSSSSLSSPS